MSGVELPGGHRRALTLAEHRRQRRELLQGGVGAQVGVAGDPQVRRDEVVEEPAVVGGGQTLVRPQGQLVLGLAGDAPLLGGDRHVVAHRQAGARLDVARRRRDQVARTDRGEGLGPVHGSAGGVGPQQGLAQPLADRDRGVRGGVDAAGDAGLDLPEGDLVGHEDGRLEARPAGLLDVVGGRRRGQRRAEDGLAGEVEVAAVLDDGAGRHLPDPLAGQPEPGDQTLEGRRQHVLVGGARVLAVGAGERDAVPAEDRGTARTGGGCGSGGAGARRATRRRGGHDP